MDQSTTNFSVAEDKARAAESLAAASGPAPRKSLLHRGGGSSPDQQREFNRATAAAIIEPVRSTQAALVAQEPRLTKLEQQVGSFFTLTERLHDLHGRLDQVAADTDESRDTLRELQHAIESGRAEHLRALERLSSEQGERLEALRNQQKQAIEAVLDEQRDRIQHLLDEQRVALRQLALQQSEAAVLADRGRRATDSRVDELASRVKQLNGENDRAAK